MLNHNTIHKFSKIFCNVKQLWLSYLLTYYFINIMLFNFLQPQLIILNCHTSQLVKLTLYSCVTDFHLTLKLTLKQNIGSCNFIILGKIIRQVLQSKRKFSWKSATLFIFTRACISSLLNLLFKNWYNPRSLISYLTTQHLHIILSCFLFVCLFLIFLVLHVACLLKFTITYALQAVFKWTMVPTLIFTKNYRTLSECPV